MYASKNAVTHASIAQRMREANYTEAASSRPSYHLAMQSATQAAIQGVHTATRYLSHIPPEHDRVNDHGNTRMGDQDHMNSDGNTSSGSGHGNNSSSSSPSSSDVSPRLSLSMRKALNRLSARVDLLANSAVDDACKHLSTPKQAAPLAPDQVILRVCVYSVDRQVKTQELLLTDDLPLTALRDAIRCTNDEADLVDWNTQDLRQEVLIEGAVYHLAKKAAIRELSQAEGKGSGMSGNNQMGNNQIGNNQSVSGGNNNSTNSSSTSSSRSDISSHDPLLSTLPPPLLPNEVIPGVTHEDAYKAALSLKRRACDLPTPSGFILIERTFYDDLRSDKAFRYSDNIVEWTKVKERYKVASLAPYEQREMETTILRDLRIRLGSHYLYQHQGECRHILIFTEMRAKTVNDIDNHRVYPLEIYLRKDPIVRCSLCDVFAAEVVLSGDRLCDENPFFSCRKCFDVLHRDEHGNLLYDDFRVFRVLPLSRTIKR